MFLHFKLKMEKKTKFAIFVAGGEVGLINVTLLLWKIKQFFQVHKLWSATLTFSCFGGVVSDMQDGSGLAWDYMRGCFQMQEDAWGLPFSSAAQVAPAGGEHHQCRGPGLRRKRKKRAIKSFCWFWQGSLCYDALKTNQSNSVNSSLDVLHLKGISLNSFHLICLRAPITLVWQCWLHSPNSPLSGIVLFSSVKVMRGCLGK